MPPTPKKNTRSSPRRFINRFLPLRMVVCDLPGKFGIFAALWDRYMYIYCFVPRGLSAEERSSRNKESLYTPSLYHIAVGNRLYVFLFFSPRNIYGLHHPRPRLNRRSIPSIFFSTERAMILRRSYMSELRLRLLQPTSLLEESTFSRLQIIV